MTGLILVLTIAGLSLRETNVRAVAAKSGSVRIDTPIGRTAPAPRQGQTHLGQLAEREVYYAAADDEPRFVDLDLGAGILKHVQNKTRRDEWLFEEVNAFYEVLAKSLSIDGESLHQRARENRDRDIDAFRDDAESEYRNEIARLNRELKATPEDKDQLNRLAAKAKRLRDARLKRSETYQDRPLEFPTFARMFRSLDDWKQDGWRGKLVTLKGHVRRLVKYPAGPNDHGIKTLYEAWMFTSHSQTNPAIVICTSIPEGMPIGEGRDYSVQAQVTGWAFKMHVYRDTERRFRKAPMILAARLDWTPPLPERRFPLWGYFAIGGAVMLGLVWWFYTAGRRRPTSDEESPDFDTLEETAG